jgi:hypothetical protein
VPAPHFYLELLRQRLTNPTLEFTLKKIEPVDVIEHCRVAAYNWQLSVRSYSHTSGRASDYCFGTENFPVEKMRTKGIPMGPILPGCEYREAHDFGLRLRPNAHTIDAVRGEIEALLDGAIFSCQLATETSPGELISIPLSPVLDVDAILDAAQKKCAGFFP